MCFTHLQLNYVYTKLRYLIIFYSIKRYFSEKYKNIILKNKKFGLILKIKDNNGNIRSLGPLFKFTIHDRELLRKVLLDYIKMRKDFKSAEIVKYINEIN